VTKQEYINRVMLIMNEAGLFDSTGTSYIGAEITQPDRLIEGSFVDAWRRCVKVMPRAWFGNASFKNATRWADLPHGYGYVILPEDFYLLTAFKMTGWRKAVYEAAIENEKTASVQSNEYTRGSQIRPVCTISTRDVGDGAIKQVLNYYSMQPGLGIHNVSEAIYLPVCKALKDYTDDEELNLDLQVIEPMAYLSASTVFTMLEKYDISKELDRRAVEMFPGLARVRGLNTTISQ